MRPDRTLIAVVIAGFLLAGAPDVRAAVDRQAADDAFNAGDTARALSLYDAFLAENPNDIQALLRSGKLLSWERKFDEALARYDRALTREPNNTELLLERGKIFLWSGRYDEAVPAFGRVLKNDPKDPWALCGTAQAYSWRGRGREARPYYERALAAQPGMKEALLGLGYLDLQEGDTSKALERADALAVIDPTNPEVIELQRQVRRARAPWIQIGWDGANDSDENRMSNYRLEGGLALPERLDLRLGVTHSDLQGPLATGVDASSRADSLFGVLGWRPKVGHRGELRLGATQLTDDAGNERTTGIGGLAYYFPISDWSGSVSISHDPFLYSPRILGNEIDVTSLNFGAYGMISPHVRLEANAGGGDFSDDNLRLNADVGSWYVWFWPTRSLSLGGIVRYLDYSDDLDNGYFDPSGFFAEVVSLRSNGSIGASPWTYEAALEGGVQSFEFDGARASGEPLWNVHGLVARPLGHGFSFQIFADFSNSSAASGPGFTSRSGGFRLRYSFGG